jgi:hypothetical protein
MRGIEHDCGYFEFLSKWYGLKEEIGIDPIVRDILFFILLLSVALFGSNRIPRKKAGCAFVGYHQPSHREQTVCPVFFSFICQNAFDGRHNFIHIIRENLRKPYLLRVNHHMRTVAAKPHTS